ncbi:MAG: SGNH/GDSL hydrolase family protein [Deltaproteobacteria bacterium]|jgi:hypothetical protein|nr:SGNH/GDSL hydrolase family protein [Deltaproteobacteria bacterium]
MGQHLVLVGDSVFDNRAYTRGEPEVAVHLREILASWDVTLRAVDGTTTVDLGPQLAEFPGDATQVVVSVGGNDALENVDLLELSVGTTAEALDMFDQRVSAFEVRYRAVVEAVVALGRPTTLCTVYNGNFEGAQARRIRIALMMFNDVVLRTALSFGLNVIELRQVCDEPVDFANPIEPSGVGGRKIAFAIARAVGALKANEPRSILSAG